MKNVDFNSIETSLSNFTQKEAEKFLDENPDLVFRAFAFDCNAEYGQVNLCFLTEDEVKNMDEGSIPEFLGELGDWKYQGIATIRVFTHDERKAILGQMPDDNFTSWRKFVDQLMDHFTKVLIHFSTTPTFQQIPKSKEFTYFCMDHIESYEDAKERMNKLQG
jgi:hypothetical protein